MVMPAISSENMEKFGWMHISCSYTQQVKAQAHVLGIDLHGDYELDLTASPSFIDNDDYTIRLGNSGAADAGTAGMMLREFRYWKTERTAAQLVAAQHMTLDPAASDGSLLLYFKMAAGDLSAFNYSPIEE
jgi:hypothetical protein